MTGDQLVKMLAALANPQRIRLLSALHGGRNYVSQLAREVDLGRPLVHMHLQKLEAAGLVRGELELSEDGKAMKYYEIVPFSLQLSPAQVADAALTLTGDSPQRKEHR